MNTDRCLRWTERRHSWRHRSEGGFDKRKYDVTAVDETNAKQFVQIHHYSKSFPAARLRYGLFECGRFVGVAVLSVPVQKAVLTVAFPALQPYIESLELGRFVLLDEVPANAESWFLGQCFRQAKDRGIKGIVSFSDPLVRYTLDGQQIFPGHVGTIYQASNALYAGRGNARIVWMLPDGTILNHRALSKVRSRDKGHEYVERLLCAYGAPPPDSDPTWLERACQAAHIRKIRHPGNHRYLFPLHRRAVTRLPRRSYPKQPDNWLTMEAS